MSWMKCLISIFVLIVTDLVEKKNTKCIGSALREDRKMCQPFSVCWKTLLDIEKAYYVFCLFSP